MGSPHHPLAPPYGPRGLKCAVRRSILNAKVMGKHSAANRRRNLRAPVDLPVVWRNPHDGETRVSSTIDISASGMALRSPVSVPRGTRIFVVVGHTDVGLRFEAAAEVARARRFAGEYVLSLSFTAIAPEVAAEIGRSVVQALAEARDDDAESAAAGVSQTAAG